MKINLSFLLIFYLLLNVIHSPVYSQCQADWLWAKGFQGPTGNDWPTAVITDKWNNVIVACTSTTTFITIDTALIRSADIVVTKFNPSGKLLWIKKFAGGEPHGLVADQNGNIYMAGLFWGGLVCDEFIIQKYTKSSYEGFLVKISPDGKALWGKKASNNTRYNSMVFMGQGLAIDTIRNKLVISGSFDGPNLIADNLTLLHSASLESRPEGFLLVYDTSGKPEWGKVIINYSPAAGSIFPLGVTTDKSGNIFISGYYSYGIKIDTFTLSNVTSGSMFCVKLDKQGKVQWLRGATKGNVRPYWMQTDLDGNVYIGGEMYSWPVVIDTFRFSPNCSQAGMVVKIDSSGNFKWVRAIPGMLYYGATVLCIAVDDIGNNYGIGYFGGDSLFIDSLRLRKLSGLASGSQPFIFKFNKDGHLVWLFRPYPTDTTTNGFLDCYKGFCISLDKQGNVFHAFGWYGWPSTPNTQKIIIGKDTIPMSGTGVNSDIVIGKIRNNFSAFARGVQVTCHGVNNGTAKLYIMGGTAPFNIQWSNSSNLQELKSLSPGWYKVSVTDANSCTVKDSIEIKEPPQLFISINIKQDSAGLHEGEASANVTGGTPPYTYLWNDAGSQKTAKATGLAKGNYTLTVTDKNGCISDTTINLTDVSDIEEMLNSNVKVYPNPVTKGSLNIEISNLPFRIILKLYDSLGKEVLEREINSGINYQDQIPLPGKGLYILKIGMDGKVISKDIVVQ